MMIFFSIFPIPVDASNRMELIPITNVQFWVSSFGYNWTSSGSITLTGSISESNNNYLGFLPAASSGSSIKAEFSLVKGLSYSTYSAREISVSSSSQVSLSSSSTNIYHISTYDSSGNFVDFWTTKAPIYGTNSYPVIQPYLVTLSASGQFTLSGSITNINSDGIYYNVYVKQTIDDSLKSYNDGYYSIFTYFLEFSNNNFRLDRFSAFSTVGAVYDLNYSFNAGTLLNLSFVNERFSNSLNTFFYDFTFFIPTSGSLSVKFDKEGSYFFISPTHSSSASDSIVDSLQSAGGSNSGLNDQNSHMADVLGDYQSGTDTSDQMGRIDSSLFDFDMSILTSVSSTITFFSSIVSSLYAHIGDFASLLTLFLTFVFIGAIIGIHNIRSG